MVRKRHSRKKRIQIVEGCIASGLGTREYATLKNVGYSTLGKWSRELGIPLFRKKEAGIKTSQPTKAFDSSMSFMDISSHIEKNKASSILSALLPQQSSQDLSRFSMEIRLPSGVMVKVDHILFPQMIECVKALT